MRWRFPCKSEQDSQTCTGPFYCGKHKTKSRGYTIRRGIHHCHWFDFEAGDSGHGLSGPKSSQNRHSRGALLGSLCLLRSFEVQPILQPCSAPQHEPAPKRLPEKMKRLHLLAQGVQPTHAFASFEPAGSQGRKPFPQHSSGRSSPTQS